MSVEMQELLQLVVDRAASDLHLKAGEPPILRAAGKLTRISLPTLSADDTKRLIFSCLSPEQIKHAEQNLELDCGFGIEGLGRFRVNVYRDRGSWAAALRVVLSRMPSLDELGLPPVCKELLTKPRGLILVTGPTGSGKSTTLAAMINAINEKQDKHILTVEDPIEFLHQNKMSFISQREVGSDTRSFANALRSGLREDPDVILVGEMRDLETIHLALTAAETGHLVFSTIHTSSAPQSVDRIIDVFPPEQQQQIRIMLSHSLVGVLSQTLLPKIEGEAGDSPVTAGRIMAMEILINTPAIANLIREAKTAQIYTSMQMGASLGMQTLESCLARYVKEGLISHKEAISKSSRPEDLEQLIGPRAAANKSYGTSSGFGRF
ncbi:MAG: type IV pilus twitching motility protein PilT [Candidatus Melainabacteria bacterium]|jgi:twitching motility protein PilT|nr:type IV pilus twitching motility protein PilT [Candidatus Melainabacteria bacterium]OPZ82912.1 MAG: Twitching mobility protein [bacterium ADurb.Bin425]